MIQVCCNDSLCDILEVDNMLASMGLLGTAGTAPFLELGYDSSGSASFIAKLLSFGPLDLHLISINIEDLTSNLPTVAALGSVTGLTATISFAVFATWASRLCLTATGSYPIWITMSMSELTATIELMVPDDATPTTNAEKTVYAHKVLHTNKTLHYNATKAGVPFSPSAFNNTLERYAPSNPSSQKWHIPGRHRMDTDEAKAQDLDEADMNGANETPNIMTPQQKDKDDELKRKTDQSKRDIRQAGQSFAKPTSERA